MARQIVKVFVSPKSRCARCAVVAVAGRVSCMCVVRERDQCARRGPLRHNRRNTRLYAARSSFLFGRARAHSLFGSYFLRVPGYYRGRSLLLRTFFFFCAFVSYLKFFGGSYAFGVRTHKFFASTYSLYLFLLLLILYIHRVSLSRERRVGSGFSLYPTDWSIDD